MSRFTKHGLPRARSVGFALLWASALISNAGIADTGIVVHWRTDLYSEPEPIYPTIKDWGDTFERGEHQWLSSEALLGYRWRNGVEFGALARAQASTRINPDAAELYGRIQRQEPLTEGQETHLILSASSFSAQGLRLGYRYRFEQGWVSFGLAYLQTDHLVDGELQGTVLTQANDAYQVQAEVDYVYYQDPIFKRPDFDQAKGEGVVADVALHWRMNNHWVLDAQGRDLAGEIKWERAPFSVGQANTERKQSGEDGYTRFNPLFSGREGYRKRYTQRLPYRIDVQLTRSLDRWQMIGHWRHQFSVDHLGIGAGYVSSSGHQWQATFWPQRDALELAWRAPRWRIALQADNVKWQQAHSLSLALEFYPAGQVAR